MTRREFLIRSLLKKGYSYAAIGKQIGLTRERIRQIAKKKGWKAYIPASRIRQEFGIPKDSIYDLLYSGRIKGFKVGGRWVIIEMPKGILSCPICGNRQKSHSKYCGLHSRSEIFKWRYWNVAGVREKRNKSSREYIQRRKSV